jgi:hypothetical protein
VSGQVGDGAPTDDHDQDGGQGRGTPQGDRSGRGHGSGVVPDPAPPREPGPPRGLAGSSRVHALDPVRPARCRVRPARCRVRVFSSTGRQASSTGRQASSTGRQASSTGRQASSTGRQASSTGRQASSTGRQVSGISGIGRQVSGISGTGRQVSCTYRPVNRQLIARLLLVGFHPESESGAVYSEFAGDLGDRPGQVGHLFGGFFLKLRRIPFRILAPGHLIPRPFRRVSYSIPVRKGRVP